IRRTQAHRRAHCPLQAGQLAGLEFETNHVGTAASAVRRAERGQVRGLLPFFTASPALPGVLIGRAALAVMVRGLHGSASYRSSGILLCYNFLKAGRRAQGVSVHYVIRQKETPP